MTKIRNAIFPVTGLGIKFLPATKAMPKGLLPITDKFIIQHADDESGFPWKKATLAVELNVFV